LPTTTNRWALRCCGNYASTTYNNPSKQGWLDSGKCGNQSAWSNFQVYTCKFLWRDFFYTSGFVFNNLHDNCSIFFITYQGAVVDGAPIIPISAHLKYNIDVVCEYIVKKIPIPQRNFVSPPNTIVIWSFDVNKHGFEVDGIKGGVAGGSIVRVSLLVNFL